VNLDGMQHFVTCGKHGEPLRQDLDGGNEASQDNYSYNIPYSNKNSVGNRRKHCTVSDTYSCR
jgi:hypothetical protein